MSRPVCGVCAVPLAKHDAPHCPYDYEPIRLNGRAYGYEMLDKNKKQKKAKNGLRGKARS
jgi:hypothetical protein